MLNHTRSSQSRTRNAIIARALVTAALLVSWPALAAAQDGSIVAWGYNSSGQTDVPTPNLDFVAVAAGWYHGLGLKASPPPTCPWDLDDDDSVGTSDLLELLGQWDTDGPADFDGDGSVGASDLLALLVNWGPCP